MSASLIEVVISDEKNLSLSLHCDAILDEFAASDWYRANVPGKQPDRYERAMCKTLLAYLITQKKPAK